MRGLEQRLLSLVSKHRERGILIDTNVLLLYLFGKFLPAAVGQKRLSRYSLEDADLILQFVGRFVYILTTQHVLAETSNLARQIVGGGLRDLLARQLYPAFAWMDRMPCNPATCPARLSMPACSRGLVSPMPDWRHWCKRITCC